MVKRKTLEAGPQKGRFENRIKVRKPENRSTFILYSRYPYPGSRYGFFDVPEL